MDNKPNNQSFSKVLLLCICFALCFALIIGGLFTLVAHASFFAAIVWTFVLVMAVLIPTLFWAYIIEPLWWGKLSSEAQGKIQAWGVGLIVLLAFVLYPAGMFGGQSWSGQGQVNLFPLGDTTKNYRLDADLDVKTGFWWSKTDTLNSVDWPDGGTTSFSNCTINNSSSTCTDDEDRTWTIEIVQQPDAPDPPSDN